MKKVKDILAKKGSEVISIAEQDSALEAARRMNERRIGSVVVTRGEQVVGLFTERDILTRIVAKGRDAAGTPVSEVMTSPVACCVRDTTLEECKGVMTDKHIRHLPVVEEGKLLGLVTSGDVMAFEATEREHTIEYLYEYLYGTAPE